jgi:hypothetical protein
MNVEQLIKNFNKTGVFPTDSQLEEAIKGNPNYEDLYDLELEMIDIARNDVNHPYHYAVSGGDKFINL